MSDIDIKINVVSQGAISSVSRLAKETKNADENFKQLNLSVKQGNAGLATFAGTLAGIAVAKGIGLLAKGFGDLAREAFDATQTLETISTQFQVLTGSAESAAKAVADLQEFSARTPFQFETVAQASQRLLSFGFTIDEVKTRLQDLGDVSAASGADLGELSLIFGQVRAAGKLTGERLLQLQERAIPIGPALAKTLGVAESSVRDLVSKGAVDFAKFEEAFLSLNETGQFAFGGIDKRSQTLAGRISTLKDNFQLFAANLGESFLPAIKAIISAVTITVQQFSSFATSLKGSTEASQTLINAFNFLGQAIGFVVNVGQSFKLIFQVIAAALTGVYALVLQSIEGWVLLADSVGKFIGLDTGFLDSTKERLNQLGEAAKSTATDFVSGAEETVVSMASVKLAANDFGVSLQEAFNKEIETSKASVIQEQVASQQKIEALQQVSEAELAEQQKRLEQKAKFEEQKGALEAEFAALELERKLAADGLLDAQDEIEILKEKDKLARINEARNLANQQAIGDENAFNLLKLKIKNDQAAREIAIEKQIREAQQKENQRKLKQTSDLFGGLAELSATGGARLFQITQGLQLAQATVAGYAAVQQAASAAPFPFNVPGIITETARAAASIIRIKQAAPQFEQGGIVPGTSFSGDNVMARLNSGEMVLNRQQQTQLFKQANGAGGGSGEVVVYTSVQIGEEEIAKAVSRQVAQGLQLGVSGV